MAQHLTTLAVIILIVSQAVSAKRGCSAFGHSCFGGHGKRSGDNAALDIQTPDIVSFRRQTGQEETPPHPEYPSSGPAALVAPGDDIIPVRDGGLYEHADNAAVKEFLKFRLRNIVNHWIDNYRRNQQGSDERYVVETM